MAKIDRRDYAALYGPTTGDAVRLGDTALTAVVEKDHAVYGDECLHGGGKTLRDGIGMAGITSAEGALDFLLCNVMVIDPVVGIVKGDLGIRHGRIVGIGKAGNPAIMDGVDPRLIVSSGTTVRDCEGLIATAGAIDVHVHFDSAGLVEHALASGITTMIGGSLGPITVGIDSGGPFNTGKMLQAAEAWPMNFGFLGRGNSHKVPPLVEQLETGVMGLKLHEDWGSMPAAIDTCLRVADEHDFQVQIHTDTLNESGFVEDTLEAIGGRTIHMYHTEGAGGGHAPDIIRVAGEMHCLPSSTNPTNPFTVNTFDEHLDMTMVCHHLNPAIPEDVAFAESRIRTQTIAAEDVLHDIGAISMLGSDSQGMGRIHEVICRTWQLASKMKEQRGAAAGGSAGIWRQRPHSPLHREIYHQCRPYLRHSRPCRFARGRQACRYRGLAAGFFRNQAGTRDQGRLHRLGCNGRQRRLADDLRADPDATAMGRIRPGASGLVGVLRASAGDRGQSCRLARPNQEDAAGRRHPWAVEARHDVERCLPENQGRSRNLRCVRRRCAGHLRAGPRSAACTPLYAEVTDAAQS